MIARSPSPNDIERSPEWVVKERLWNKLKVLTSLNKAPSLNLNLLEDDEETEEIKRPWKFTGDSLLIPSPKNDDEVSIEMSDEKVWSSYSKKYSDIDLDKSDEPIETVSIYGTPF